MTTSLKVECVCYTRGRTADGRCEDQRWEQRLVKRWHMGRLTVWATILDREEVPANAIIEQGCFGETSWRSKFAKIQEAWK